MTVHTLNNTITCASPSQGGEHCVRSRYVSAQSLFRDMDGKNRKFDPYKGVVNTPLCVTEPRVPLRSNLDDPEEWELHCSDGESACWDEVHRTGPVACRPIIKCGTMGAVGLVYSLWRNMGRQLGRSQLRAGSVGRPVGFLGMFFLVNSRHLLALLRKKSHWRPRRGNPKSRVFSSLVTVKQVNWQ